MLSFFLYACISPLFTESFLSSIDCNIVLKDILQTRLRWMHEREVMLMISPYQLLTQLQHPRMIQYHLITCVLSVDIPHTEIHICHRSIPHSVWNLATHPSLLRSHIYRVLQIANAASIQCHAVSSNAQTFMHKFLCLAESYAGAHVFIQVLSAPLGQREGLLNVLSIRPVCLVLFHVRRRWPTSNSCIHTECWG